MLIDCAIVSHVDAVPAGRLGRLESRTLLEGVHYRKKGELLQLRATEDAESALGAG